MIAEHNQELADTLNARTFAMAQAVDGAAGMMNICSTCQGAQSECQERLDATPEYREHVNKHLEPEGLRYERGGAWWNKNLLWILVEEIGLDKLREKVVRPLEGLRVGPFYGCYIVRPTERGSATTHYPDRGRYLQQVIEVLGATPVDYAGAHKCCGFPVITMNRTTSLRQAGRHMADAIDAGADCVVTPCPLCHLNLDMQQPEAAKFVERDLGMPVLHLPQLRRPRPRPRAEGARDGQARRGDGRGRAQGRRARDRLARTRTLSRRLAGVAGGPPLRTGPGEHRLSH